MGEYLVDSRRAGPDDDDDEAPKRPDVCIFTTLFLGGRYALSFTMSRLAFRDDTYRLR